MKFEEVEDTREFPVAMSFRCAREDEEDIRHSAKAAGLSLSAYIRRCSTGATVFSPIQDIKDFCGSQTHYGFLKKLVEERREIRPTLDALGSLIAEMTNKIRSTYEV